MTLPRVVTRELQTDRPLSTTEHNLPLRRYGYFISTIWIKDSKKNATTTDTRMVTVRRTPLRRFSISSLVSTGVMGSGGLPINR
ncbi:hypothetical protein HDE76_002586 [Rhodanobacter sp. ANJX3]|uniref:hypothetical protein n=1 Tax=unclassified Rhodanobacter TaxID=2621553 RepID=UPI00161DFC57|nr:MULTISPECIES: hypothetical protein [unclassified Rhodanobacter]MBB5359357.1 hypothetical protein [Rhodanobacter sp. ANJX3]